MGVTAVEIWHSTFLGRRTLPAELSDYQVQAFFTFSADDLASLKQEFYSKTRTAAAIQLGYLALAGTELDAIRMLPRNLLRHVCEQLDLPAPSVATLKSLFKSKKTRLKQMAWAMDRLGWRRPSLDTDRKLSAYLDDVAHLVVSKAELLDKARQWSYDGKFLLRAESAYERICASKFAASEDALFREIDRVVPQAKREEWIRRLLEPSGKGRATNLEWLGKAPSGRGPRARADVSDKVAFLKELGVERSLLNAVPIERIKHYARQFAVRKPSRLERLTDPLKAIELVSFLWLALMRFSDLVISMSRKAFASLKGSLRAEVTDRRAASALELMRGMEALEAVMDDETLDLVTTRNKALEIIAKFKNVVNPNKAEVTREMLVEEHRRVDALIRPLLGLDLDSAKDGVAMRSIELLRDLVDSKKTRLPPGDAPCRDPWTKMVNQRDDPEKAYHAFVAVTLEEVLLPIEN